MHTIERQAEQLALAGIGHVAPTDVSWLTADVDRFALPAPYVLLSPGASQGHAEKRWPAERYAALARDLAARGVTPVILGTATEADAAATILAACPAARSLIGQTSLADIAALARGAAGAVGNDTGPMHLIAAAGCPTVVLFGPASDPALAAPRGPAVTVIRRPDLAALDPTEVAAALNLV
jgi:ADP-heptose:LPS heptosyltransferase